MARLIEFRSRQAGLAAGKALRGKVPRESHAYWKPTATRRDPVAILEESSRDRLPELIPIRYGRMARSPFTFLRGAAALMAHDLATTLSTGLRVQACGDCHLLNFGLFATRERNLVFDINDFDETLPAPWEWDVKRLAVSFVVAARDNDHSDAEARGAAMECVRAYRKHLREDSKLSPLEIWYERMDMQTLIEEAPDAKIRKRREALAARAHKHIGEHLFPKIATKAGGRHHLVDQPPVLYHIPETYGSKAQQEALIYDAMEHYRDSLHPAVRVLFDRYRLEDWAIKVVGIGSVGTRCLVGLFFSFDGYPLLLQFKEARPSVLAPYAGKSPFENEAEREVTGQRLIQSSSDIFLGWTRTAESRDFIIRQLRDMKLSFPVAGISPARLRRHAERCGTVLARAAAKSGDAAAISGYLGTSDAFDQAIGHFASEYADQNERDYAAFAKAIDAGSIEALIEEDL